ncbi:glycerophosphodiester phosphodiesterase family protein [Marinicella sediminis]
MHRSTVFILIGLMTMQISAKPLMIAHAGGGYLDTAYTNSIDALNQSYERGFRLIEMDFSWTADEQLVCLHDWESTHKKLFGNKPAEPLSLQAFEQQLAAHPHWQVCTAATLAVWLAVHADVRIITDIKHHNLKGIRKLITDHPQIKAQLIPQFYQPQEYQQLRELGFVDLIWILYQYKGSKQSVVELSQDMELMAVSMRSRQAKSRTLQKLRKKHRLFVYTINQSRTLEKLHLRYGVSGFYSDFLSP